MTIYLILATILFTLTSSIWTTDSLLNLMLKLMFTGMAGWSVFLLAQNLGYVVKV